MGADGYLRGQTLLIVPYGIEILENPNTLSASHTFNCTLWN